MAATRGALLHRRTRSGDPPTARRRGLAIVTGAFWSMVICANLATPLYAGYSERFGFSTVVLGLSLQVGALAVFAAAGTVLSLFLARALQGLALGMMSGAATAALAELFDGEDTRRPALLATLAQSGGTATGVLLSGMLAQWVSHPDVVPFAVGMAICMVMIVLLLLVPETGLVRGGWQVQRPRVPEEIRSDFARVGTTAAAVWAVAGGLFLSVVPSYASDVFETTNLALLGLLTAVLLATSCVAQILIRNGAPPAQTQAGGLALLAAGLLGLVLATSLSAPVLLIAGAALAGAGHGLAFLAAQDDLTRIAPDDRRAEISAAFYVCMYLGVSVPVIGVGVLAAVFSLFTAVAVFAAVTGTAALLTAAWHLRTPAEQL